MIRKIGLGVALLLMTGCAVGPSAVYEADFNIDQKPAMSLPQAIAAIKQELHTMEYAVDDLQVTSEGFTFRIAPTDKFNGSGKQYSARFNDYQSLILNNSDTYQYFIFWNSIVYLRWASQNDGQNFIDAVMAIKHYTSKQSLSDDASAFADFQEKARAWQALPQKPPLPEEARRFRVLADDAVQNRDFDKAADYYEQGLAIDPLWPAGQFNAAMIYKESGMYPMAVIHLKRYLALKPEDTPKYRDQMYIWEAKASE